MKDTKIKPKNRRLKSKIPEKQARLIAFIMVLPVFFILSYKVTSYLAGKSVSAQQFVDLQQGEQIHAGFRRAHAKGICVTGTFESSGALNGYSTAMVFDEGSYPIVGRFSTAGSNPTAPDLASPVRSLAFVMSGGVDGSQNAEWRIAMNTPPVMAVGTPEDFYAQLQALSPDPVTKERDPAKIQAFFAQHPESKAFLDWRSRYVPADSSAGERYHSINAFYLVDEKKQKQAVRFQAVPLLDSSEIPSLDNENPDALQVQLEQIFNQYPIKFNLVFTLADSSDDENDPTIMWPSERRNISAGTLVINSLTSEEIGQCANLNFDPLVLPEGVAATADPILRARSAAYAESFRRRAMEVLLGKDEK
jgi:catalase